MESYQERLAREMSGRLPGTESHDRMAPSDRTRMRFNPHPDGNSRKAAVLILLYPYRGHIHTLFIMRPEYPGIHGGQISLPGGKSEPGDQSEVHTALREAAEETGILPDEIRVLGKLSPLYIPVSNTVVHPVAGSADKRPEFRPDPREVEYIIEIPLKELADPVRVKQKTEIYSGVPVKIPYYDLDGKQLWGATAMIMSEFIDLAGRPGLRFPW